MSKLFGVFAALMGLWGCALQGDEFEESPADEQVTEAEQDLKAAFPWAGTWQGLVTWDGPEPCPLGTGKCDNETSLHVDCDALTAHASYYYFNLGVTCTAELELSAASSSFLLYSESSLEGSCGPGRVLLGKGFGELTFHRENPVSFEEDASGYVYRDLPPYCL